MAGELKKYIDGLAIDDNQRLLLKQLIDEDKKEYGLKFLHSFQEIILGDGSVDKTEESDRISQKMDQTMAEIAKTVKESKKIILEANQSFNKIDLLLAKRELWLSDLVEKLSVVSNEISDNFVQILQTTQSQLKLIEQTAKNNWQELKKKQTEAEEKLMQVNGKKMDKNLDPVGFEQQIKTSCQEYIDYINKITGEFNTSLDQTVKQLDELTSRTKKEMKQIARQQKLADLEKQIAQIK